MAAETFQVAIVIDSPCTEWKTFNYCCTRGLELPVESTLACSPVKVFNYRRALNPRPRVGIRRESELLQMT